MLDRDACQVELQHLAHCPAGREDILDRAGHPNAAVLGAFGQHGLGLEVGVFDRRGPKCAFQDDVGIGHPCLEVAFGDVMAGTDVLKLRGRRVGVKLGCRRLQGVLWVEYAWQVFVLDFDGLCRGGGLAGLVGGDNCQRIAIEAHPVGDEHRQVLDHRSEAAGGG